MKAKHSTLFLAALLVLTGCASPLEKSMTTKNKPTQKVELNESPYAYALNRNWWQQFKAPGLAELLEQSLNQNLALKASFERIQQARSQITIESAALKPLSNLQINTQSNAPIAVNITDQRNKGIPEITLGLGVSYNLDLFGQDQAVVDAKTAQFTNAIAMHHATSLVTITELASYYFSLVSLNQQLELEYKAQQLLNNQLEIQQNRYSLEGGQVEIELSNTQQKIEQSNSRLAALNAQQDTLKASIAVLLGTKPDHLVLEGLKTARLDSFNLPQVSPDQPATLLSNRPDIQSAEAQLLAAQANIEAAKAAFYPSFSIGANLFLAGNPSASAVTLASSVLAPIFKGGQLQGKLEQEQAKQRELAANYQQTVLKAFFETHTALIEINEVKNQQQDQLKLQELAEHNLTIAQQQYSLSSINLNQLLNYELATIKVKQDLETKQLEAFIAGLRLFKALGGQWQSTK